MNVCIFTLFNHLYLEKRKRKKYKWCLTLSGCLCSINSLAGILYTAEAAVLMGYLWMFLCSVYSYLEGLPLSCQCLYPMCLPGLVKVTQQTTLAFSEFKWAKWAGELPKSHFGNSKLTKIFPQHIPLQIIHSQIASKHLLRLKQYVKREKPHWSRPPWKQCCCLCWQTQRLLSVNVPLRDI